MIEFKELRIGNLVKCKVSNDAGIYKVWNINGLGERVIIDRAGMETHQTTNIKPIPITEEWLLKFGFELDGDEYYNDIHGVYPNVKDGGYCFMVFESEYITVNTILKHVHQLQNLYFALAGEELEIKE